MLRPAQSAMLLREWRERGAARSMKRHGSARARKIRAASTGSKPNPAAARAPDHEGGAMSEIERIVVQLNRSFERESWHGPAVLEVLEGVTAAEASFLIVSVPPLEGSEVGVELTLESERGTV